ncbi:MAG: hypothetical protein C5B60_02515 [Chloroflexi bacterium]|nr:MAG: hypothetical protein C5B60_02515 [Chloroflexota bacterium]
MEGLTLALSSGLPVSRIVSVQVSLTTPAVIAQVVNTCMLLGTSPIIDPVQRRREYANILEVAAEFGIASEEYRAATLWFAQNPSPNQLFIGRWVKDASPGMIIGAPLGRGQQAMSQWTGLASPGFAVAIDGAAEQQVSGLSFAGMTNLNAVAAAITTAIGTGATMVWNQRLDRFELRSASTGPTSALSFLTAPATGADISQLLGMQAASSGAYAVPGMAPETALEAAVELDMMFSAQWYALVCPSADDEDHEELAAYVEAGDPPHYYGVTTAAAGSLVETTTDDIGYILSSYGYHKTAVQFSRTTGYAIMSYLARILTTRWAGSNTTITQKFKQQPGVVPENISTQQANVLDRKRVNVFTTYSNGARMVQEGRSSSGEFTDVIIGSDALALEIQGRLFNVLYQAPKVPQTDAGMQLLVNGAAAACSMYAANGHLASGTWNAMGFGNLSYGDPVPDGFYIYVPSMLTQDQAERQRRRAPLMQVAAKIAGAVHFADVLVWVNQ